MIGVSLPAAWAAQHFIILGLAYLHVNVLLKRIEVEEGQGVVPGVVGPVGGSDTLLHFTGISKYIIVTAALQRTQ